MAYIETVNRMDFPPEKVDRKTEKMVRAAMDLPADAHNTLGVMQHLEVGLYTARRIVSILSDLNGRGAPPRQYQAARERAPAPEPSFEAPREAPATRERPPLDDDPIAETQEARPMFRRRKKEEERPPRPVDRSNAATVTFDPGTSEYHGRKCLFHGESAVAVCPNCGTLFCTECADNLDACPRCNLAIDFVDQSKVPLAVDDRDLIETDAQRKAIQQRWAMKRLAEADMNSQAKKREIRAATPDRDKMVEKLMRDTHKAYGGTLVQDAPKQAYRAALERTVEPTPQEPTLQDQIELIQQDAPEPQVYAPADPDPERSVHRPAAEEPMEEGPAPEELLPEDLIPTTKKADDKREKLLEILSQDDAPSEESRDLSRL
jgi:hypothetical protein